MDNREIRERFAALAAPHVADACIALSADVRAAADVRPLERGSRAAGRALPVEHFGSVDVFFEAMSAAAPGDVLVIDNGGRRDEGCIGDLTAVEAKAFGVSAIVVWGVHRDSGELRDIALPIFSLGSCPLGPRAARARKGLALPESIGFGDARVSRDDVVFADEDGVLFVPASVVPAVLDRAAEIARAEQQQRRMVARGVTLHDQFEWPLYESRRAVDPAYTLRQHLQSLNKAIET
ncbi:MAG TPA: RraA family protein [Thermoanaerobaculia bacterium]|nr:RraA family protein [Thermoanaerobaculia bacterium]